jgi:hypothetical protein
MPLLSEAYARPVPSWRWRRRTHRDLLYQDEERTTESLSLMHEALENLTYDIGQR